MDKIKFLTEQNIQDIIAFIVDDQKIDYAQAINSFYSSQTFKLLSDPDTGLYRESPAYIYELYKSELVNGCLIQTEQ